MTTLTVISETYEKAASEQTAVRDGGGMFLLRVAGEFDLASGSAVREEVHSAVADGWRSIVLDLSAVRFCDSSGVGVLIAARRLLRSCGGELRLVLPEARDGGDCAEVHRVFRALGVRRLFDIHPDLASATGARLPAAAK